MTALICGASIVIAGVVLAWSLCRTARYVPVVREDEGEYE